MTGERYVILVFANTVNTSFSYMFFHLLNKNHVAFNFQKLPSLDNVITRGGARGGLGGYSPPSEHASPRSEGESDFFVDFWQL